MKTWCRHIKHVQLEWGTNSRWAIKIEPYRNVTDVPRSWKVCPICLTARPKKLVIPRKINVRKVLKEMARDAELKRRQWSGIKHIPT